MRVWFLLSSLLSALPLAAQEEKDPAWQTGYAFGQLLGYLMIAALVWWGFRRIFRKGRK